ncbi:MULTISPECIES: hypothetical protein [Cyanophyceae]|nr:MULTISPECIES: hypothetical protein [unclassified Trichocoleus]
MDFLYLRGKRGSIRRATGPLGVSASSRKSYPAIFRIWAIASD